LRGEGWLKRDGRSYSANVPAHPSARSTVLLVARTATGGTVDFPRAYDSIRELQQECTTEGVTVELVQYGRTDTCIDDLRRKVHDHIGNPVLGIIIWTLTIPEREVLNLLSSCRALGVPVSIIDDSGTTNLVPHHHTRNVCLFSTVNDRHAGAEIGRTLAALGHRRVAFISASHETCGSAARAAGLEHVLKRCGGHVYRFVDDWRERTDEMVSLRSRLLEALGGCLTGRSLQRMPVMNEQLTAELREAVIRKLGVESEHMTLHSLMEDAVQYDEVTAWACYNDNAAVQARRFLANYGRQVPDDISLIGIDDTPAALEQSLASYNFNGRAVMRAALLNLLYPARMRRFEGHYQVEGFLSVRSSLGRAPPRRHP